LLQQWPGEAIRLAMLTTHYRQPLNWTEAGVREAKRTLDHWYELTGAVEPAESPSEQVIEALCDDLNTPRALAALHELRRAAAHGDREAAASLKASARFVGLLSKKAEEWSAWRPASAKVDEKKVAELIEARAQARRARKFDEADRIRDELGRMGVAIKDSPEGTTWEVVQ
ncbi:MAG: cysteine--tRNA ligase, partial [Alphaproteobacteria bacterium]